MENSEEELIEKLNQAVKDGINNRFRQRKYVVDEHPATIAMNIKGYREQLGISQNQLAERLNVNRSTIVNWESGKTAPDAYQMEDLAKIFDIGVQELYTKKIYLVKRDDSTNRYLEREEQWLKNHPKVLMYSEIKKGKLLLWEGEFARDYIWITRDDLLVIALELVERGFCVTGIHPYDDYDISPDGGIYPLEIYLKKDDITNFRKAISEILVDFANGTSRFKSVVDLRRARAFGKFDRDYMEKDTVMSYYTCITLRASDDVLAFRAHNVKMIDEKDFDKLISEDGDYPIVCNYPFLEDFALGTLSVKDGKSTIQWE